MRLLNIDFVLSLGQLIWKQQLRPIVGLLIIALLFPLVTIAMLCSPMNWNMQVIVCMTCANILSLILIGYVLFLLIRDKLNKKKVSKWLNDAIMLKAYSRKLDEVKRLFLPKGIIIQVSFELNGVSYIKESSLRVFGGGPAYYAISKYADRQISIMYSPSFDEVMILKDNLN